MSRRKLLIQEVFDKVKKNSEKGTKNGWASDLADYLDKNLKFTISEKTLTRYYDSFVGETKEETGIDNITLNKLSEYLGFNDFADFSRTFEKKDEEANKTTVKISVEEDEESLTEKLSKIIINITNEQHFKIPDFIKKNGLGLLEMSFVILLVTGGVFFSNGEEKKDPILPFGLAAKYDTDKKYMYWNGEEYLATDSSYISPEFNVVAMDERKFLYFRRNTRKDTLTVDNAVGTTWYSKYYGEVEFFTDDGIDPDNGRELKKSTELIIEKYAGKNADSLYVE